MLDPYSVLGGWDGSVTTGAQVVLLGGFLGGSDYLQIFTADAARTRIPLGQITLGSAGYLPGLFGGSVSYGAPGASTPTTMTRNGASITLTLGSSNGASSTSTTSGAMTWSPSSSVTDIAGNAGSTATAKQSGAVHANF